MGPLGRLAHHASSCDARLHSTFAYRQQRVAVLLVPALALPPNIVRARQPSAAAMPPALHRARYGRSFSSAASAVSPYFSRRASTLPCSMNCIRPAHPHHRHRKLQLIHRLQHRRAESARQHMVFQRDQQPAAPRILGNAVPIDRLGKPRIDHRGRESFALQHLRQPHRLRQHRAQPEDRDIAAHPAPPRPRRSPAACGCSFTATPGPVPRG